MRAIFELAAQIAGLFRQAMRYLSDRQLIKAGRVKEKLDQITQMEERQKNAKNVRNNLTDADRKRLHDKYASRRRPK